MIDNLLQQSTVPILEQVAIFGQKRHQVLAGNVVNIDTPDYRTRDLPMADFEKALQQAITARRSQGANQPLLPGVLSLDPGRAQKSSLQWQMQPLGSNTPEAVPLQAANARDFFPKLLTVPQEGPNRNLTFHDGGNRSIERESMEMVKNASMQSFAIEVMRSQMSMLSSVISERVI